MTAPLLRAPEVAALLGHAVEWWYQHRGELERQGFPRPVLGHGRGQRWDPAAIGAWFTRRSFPDDERSVARLMLPTDAEDRDFAERALRVAGRG